MQVTGKTAAIVHYGPRPKQRPYRPVSTAVFIKSAASPADFPADTGREVAFVGRSNSGKSTAVNALTGSRKLARVSKTPGRTQLLNFFSLGEDRRLVDLPGYGFARVGPEVQARWRRSLETYLSERASLVGLVVTMDIRRGMTPLDEQLLRWLEPRELPVGVLLTKADKVGRSAGYRAGAAARRGARAGREALALFGARAATALPKRGSGCAAGSSSPGEKKIKMPRVRDSGDAPGAATPAGWARVSRPRIREDSGGTLSLGAEVLVPGAAGKVPRPPQCASSQLAPRPRSTRSGTRSSAAASMILATAAPISTARCSGTSTTSSS